MNERLRAYLQLFRLPNVFTAMADVLAGFFVTHPVLAGLPWHVLALLLTASSLLYTAGMVLNDVFDAEQDARERPHRPIPSGRISRPFARQLGLSMLVLGVGCGWLASHFAVRTDGAIEWRPAIISTLLAAAVLMYDKVLKRSFIAPFAMGSCRFLNVLLGMSAAATAWDPAHYLIAGGIGIYIVGVTWFARTEAHVSRRGMLLAGVLLMAAGIGTLALFPQFLEGSAIKLDPRVKLNIWYAWLALLAGFVLIRCGRAVIDPAPGRVQSAVKQAILWLIFLDAAACVAVCAYPALFIVLLIIPAMWLGKWVYST